MEATINNANKHYERTCPICGENFVANNAKRQFCSNNCRSENHRQKKSSTLKEQERAVQHQAAKLSELKAAPVSRTELVQVTNTDWRLAQQGYEAQEVLCHKLKKQLYTLKDEANELRNPTQGAYLGALVGMAGVSIWMAVQYDNRKRKPLGMAFGAVAVVALITMALIGYWVGQGIHRFCQADDEQHANRLSETIGNQKELINRVKAETDKLDQLRATVSQIPKYESETVSTVNETRVVAATQ